MKYLTIMDFETLRSERVKLQESALETLHPEARLLSCAALMICRKGTAAIQVNLNKFLLHKDSVLMLFPGDAASINASDDFRVEMLRFDGALLREASLQLEHAVYSDLRRDRCRTDEPAVAAIINSMFSLLRIYFRQDDCRCKDQLALYQLKSFFLGYYDFLVRRQPLPSANNPRSAQRLFTLFMEQLENNYKSCHTVAHYAQMLHITPKYLNHVTHNICGHTPKTLIDHYVIMRIKLDLRTTADNIKQIAWDYHFSDASFFCRHFRKHTGMTPQEYRQKYKDAQTAPPTP